MNERRNIVFTHERKIINLLTDFVGDSVGANILFFTGTLGFFILHILMPLRIFWHVYKLAKGERLNVTSMRYCLALILLMLSLLGVIEIWYAVLTAGPASGAGMLLPLFLTSPLLVYFMYEVMIFNVEDVRMLLHIK